MMTIDDCQVESIVEMAGKAVVIATERWRLRSTGYDFLNRLCAVFTFRGEKIADVLVIGDYSYLAQAMQKAAVG